MIGVTFKIGNNSKHSFKDWNLILTHIKISEPEPQLYTIDIPGMDGVLDLSEALAGEITYNTRKITLEFYSRNKLSSWLNLQSDIWNFMQGKTVQIILDSDKGFYYEGRASIDSTKNGFSGADFVINATVNPYKYEIESGLVPWVWDTFNFETGIIREYNGLVVNNELKLIVPGRRKTNYLTINSSEDMILTFNDRNFNIRKGSFKYLNIELKEGIELFGSDRKSNIVKFSNERIIKNTDHMLVFTYFNRVKKLSSEIEKLTIVNCQLK